MCHQPNTRKRLRPPPVAAMPTLKTKEIESRTIAVRLDNEPGVLARVIGLFSGRVFNIESLTVTEVDPRQRLSRITVVTSGTPQILEQIKAQLDRLVDRKSTRLNSSH